MAFPDPPSKFKVALIQTCPKPNNPQVNFDQAKNHIEQAAAEGASLAILPEYHLTAFQPDSSDFIPACQTSHVYLERYQTLAKTLDINICAGTIVLTPTPEDPATVKYTDDKRPTLLNTSYFISNTGEILGSYTKTNLWHPERDHLTSSVEHHNNLQQKSSQKPSTHTESLPEPHRVIETPLGPVGIVVCWDIAFPEAFRSLIQQGAKIILAPTFWLRSDMSPEGLAVNPDAEQLFLQSTLISRAFENTAAIIFCNAGGPKDEGYFGISQVALPIVGAVKGSFMNGEVGMRVVEVDMSIVEMAEDNYKVREDMKREDWHYGYDQAP